MAEANRNTVQKEVVERIVLSAYDHPSAETVYARARLELPNISLGTVYRILKKLVAEGLVQEISRQNAPSVFDKTTCMHAHLVCSECGAIEDVFLDEHRFKESVLNECGHQLNGVQISFSGVCAKCADLYALSKASQ